MTRLLRALSASLVLLLSWAAVAAQEEPPAINVVLVSSEIAQGPNRFLFSLTDATANLVAAPDVEVHLRFYQESDPEAVAFETDARFLWAIEDVRGLYAADVEFPHAGRWGTRFDATFPDGRTEAGWRPYDVLETTSTPAIGSPAPRVDTPTAADVGGDISRISSDPDPVPRLYELSILDAIEADAPAIIAFVTPAFCQTATCGPTLEKVKQVAGEHPEVNVVHVEPYLMHVKDGYLQPLLSEEFQLQAAPWTRIWGLRTEPYVVVLDAEGTVRAKFEGAITVEEVEDVLAGL